MGEEAFDEYEILIDEGRSLLLRRRHGDKEIQFGICDTPGDLPVVKVSLDYEQLEELHVAIRSLQYPCSRRWPATFRGREKP